MTSLWLTFWRSAIYEVRFLRHNRWDFTMLFWLPCATIFLVWWIFSRPFITDLPIAVIDESHSPVSQMLIHYLETSPDLTVRQQYNNQHDAYNAILAQQVYGVVIIPKDFATNINSATVAPVILKVNAQYGTHSGIVQRGVQSAVGTISAGIEIKRMVKQGVSPTQAGISYAPISINRVSLFNAGTNYQQFLASTVLPALLHILAMIIGATTIGREIRDHSLGIWYQCATTDIPPPDFEAKKHLPPHAKFKPTSRHFEDVYVSDFDQYGLSKLSVSQSDNATRNMVTNKNMSDETFNKIAINDQSKEASTIKATFLSLVMALNGKLIWGLLPYTLWGAVVLILAVDSHAASLASILVVYVLFLLLMMISLWLGAIFSLLAYSLRIGLSITGFISAPAYAFAGITFPLVAMSDNAQRWANILPLTPYLKVQVAQLQMLAPPALAMPYIYGFIIGVAGCMLVTVFLCQRAFTNPLKWGVR